jgi:hypothetical protein
MIYGLSLLALLLALVTGIPAWRKIVQMRDIDRNGRSTTGTVISSKSAMGWLWVAEFGNQDRPLIRYQSPKGAEMVLEVVTSSVLPVRRYQPGQAITVVYDQNLPGRAYAQPEWKVVKREFALSLGSLLAAIGLWLIGRLFNLPF